MALLARGPLLVLPEARVAADATRVVDRDGHTLYAAAGDGRTPERAAGGYSLPLSARR